MQARSWGVLVVLGCLAGCGQSQSDGGDDAGVGPGTDATAPMDGSVGADANGSGDARSVADAADAVAPSVDARNADGADGADGGAKQAIGIPMYMDPSTQAATWTQAIGAAPTVRLLVANPNSGPGAAVDATYTSAIANAESAGITIVGYVHTSYGGRAAGLVTADIDGWYSLYPAIEGIFLDEVSTDPATATSYYAPIYQHVKQKSAAATVIVNPGAIPDEAYMSVADIVVSFEDTYANYTNGTYPPNPSWIAKYAPSRFWHLVLSAATTTDMQNAVSIARQRNAGYVYVSDQGPATAYQQIVTGTYWSAEIAAVNAP